MARLISWKSIFIGSSLLVSACNVDTGSDIRSLLGLEAGQDSQIRQSGARTFIVLSDWFQAFKASPSGKAGSTTAADLSSRIPASSVSLMRAYLKDQIERHDAFDAALAKNSDPEIVHLLELEMLEMKDIALALLSNSSSWLPPTGDKLATIIVASRLHSSFADRFATKGFLDVLFAEATAAQLVADIDRQGKAYLDAMVRRYSGNAPARAALRQRLGADRKVIAAMMASLDKPSAALSLTADEGGTVSGPSAVMMSFLSQGHAEADQKQKSYGNAAAPVLSNEVADAANGTTTTSESAQSQLEANPYSAIKQTNAAYAPFFQAAPPDLTLAFANDAESLPASSNSTVTPKTNPVSPVSPVSPVNPYDPNTPYNPYNPYNPYDPYNNNTLVYNPYVTNYPVSMNQAPVFISSNDSSIAIQGAKQSSKYASKPAIAAPAHDCTKMGFKGADLVGCQRYLAYANAQWKRAKSAAEPASPGRTLGSYALAGVESNTALIKAYIIQGSTDDGVGDVSQQGSLPSCTQHGLHSVIRLNLRAKGIDPSSVLVRTGEDINNIFRTTQNQQPMMEAAISAAKSYYGSKIEIKSRQVTSWAEGRELLLKNARPLFIGLDIGSEWTANGGGAEFSLRDALAQPDPLALAASLPKLRCGGVGGHAVALVGFIGNDPIIQNSWGADWHNGGLALVDAASCMDSGEMSVIYDVEVLKR